MPLFSSPNIEKLKSSKNIPGLLKALNYEKDDSIPKLAFESLVNLGKIKEACVALGNIRNSTIAIPLLKEAIEHERNIYRTSAMLALQKHNWEPDKSPAAAWYWIEKRQYAKCGEVGEAALGPLKRVAYGRLSDHDILEVIAALNKIGGAQANQILQMYLSNQNPRIRSEAKAALTTSDVPVEEIFLSQLGEESVRELGILKSNKAVEPILNRLETEPRFSSWRFVAIEALGRIKDERALNTIINHVLYYDGKMRQTAQAALKEFGKTPIPVLVQLLATGPLRQLEITAETLKLLKWQPDATELAAKYYAALNEWGNCAKLGSPAIVSLIEFLQFKLNTKSSLQKQLDNFSDPLETYMDDDSSGHSTYKMEMQERSEIHNEINKVENQIKQLVNTLSEITGQGFEIDVVAWKEWQEKNKQ